tara:strand:+ start:3966 stop:5288 length:1323 start_codon:yes stop_codon:yes gene_type:complete
MSKSLESEQHLIACAIIDENRAADLLDLPESWFALNAHKLILRTIRELVSASLSADLFSISDSLSRNKLLISAGGMEYLSELAESLPNLGFWNSYRNSLESYHKLRMIDQLKVSLENQLNGSAKPEEIVSFLQASVVNLMTSNSVGGFKKVGLHLSDALAEIEWRYENPGKLLGLATGFDDFDLTIDGFEPGKNYIIGGRPGSGKTAFALNIAERLAQENNGCYFSLEMTGKSLSKRLLTNKSRVSNTSIRSGQLVNEDFAAIAAAVTMLHTSKLFIDETPGLSVNQLRSRLKTQQLKQGKIEFVVIDHIGLIAGDPRKNATESLAEVSNQLLSMAKEFDCPFIILAQINRGTEGRQDKRPMVSDLKQSGRIEENADVIVLLYRDDYYDPTSQDAGITEVNIGKNRDGEAKMVPFRHNMAIGHYDEALNWEPKTKPQGKF